jgi:AGCS family alanine or glycine:cation symporter
MPSRLNFRCRSLLRPWLIAAVSLFICAVPCLAQDAAEAPGFDEKIDTFIGPIAEMASAIVFYGPPVDETGQRVPIVLILLATTAIFLTIYFKFINIRGFRAAVGTIKGKYTDPNAPGQITHFQALSAALSATVGLGNIAGVAVALGIGGPGATFWMILIGFCGMTTKFAECTLGVRFRKVDEDGKTRGGAMYYLSEGLKQRGLGGLGKGLAIFFAVMCVGGGIGAGNMFQANQAYAQISDSFGIFQDSAWAFGLIVAVLVGLVIIGGIVWIARVTSLLVPFMCVTYLVAAIVVLIVNATELPGAIIVIFESAFNGEAAVGGVIGVMIQGIKRGVFSNEAGVGSAPIAHSAVKTNRPASEGLVALLEPFIDTVVVCTMSALVIVSTGMWEVKASVPEGEALALRAEADAASAEVGTLAAGTKLLFTDTLEAEVDGEKTKEITWYKVQSFDKSAEGWAEPESLTLRGGSGIWLTSEAFRTVIEWFPYVLSIAVFLFAFSTMISWSYYGEQAVIYLFGKNPAVVFGYKVMFCGFVIIGASSSLGNVVTLADALFFCMVIPNLIGVYLLLPVVKEELNSYLDHVRSVDRK